MSYSEHETTIFDMPELMTYFYEQLNSVHFGLDGKCSDLKSVRLSFLSPSFFIFIYSNKTIKPKSSGSIQTDTFEI